MAETASTFCETIWLEYMKKEFPDIKRDLAFIEFDGAYASIARQLNFVIFEKKAHELIKNGGSSKDVEELYFDLLKNHFGDSVELDDLFKYEYLYIPHIFETPFYCYAYAFGLLLSMSLYQKYLEDNNFKNNIIHILKSGSNDSPRNILKKAGIEMNEEFWQKGFDYLKSLIKELK
jgi:oligoendopeptidase F